MIEIAALLGAAAGAAATEVGTSAVAKLREALSRKKPQEAERLDALMAELERLSGVVAELAEEDEDVRAGVDQLRSSVDIGEVQGSQAVVQGDVGKQVNARDVNNMSF